MSESNYLMILAVLFSPLIAVQVQKYIEKWRESRGRKLIIFKKLMASRGTPISPQRVEALNMIDLEFDKNDEKERAVLEAWKVYLDHVNDAPHDSTVKNYQTKLDAWTAKTEDFEVDLLLAMAQSLGYAFDKVQLKRGYYAPQGHADLELEQLLIRKGMVALLTGRGNLPVKMVLDKPGSTGKKPT